jgi:hypothetical protein
MNYRFQMNCMALAACAVFAVACESGMRSPVSPSAVVGGASALNADGSNLKVNAPLALSPLFEQTNTALKPALAARGSTGIFARDAALSHRFQVADSDSFANIVASGTGTSDAAGITRWTVDTDLAVNKRYVWRVRAEMGDGFGPWSKVMAFTTVKAGGSTIPPPTVPVPGGLNAGSSNEEFRVFFFDMVTQKGVGPNASAQGLRTMEPELSAVGIILQKKDGTNPSGRIYLPTGTSNHYTRTIDLGAFGGPWQWNFRGATTCEGLCP